MVNKFLLKEGITPLAVSFVVTVFFYLIDLEFLGFLFLLVTLFIGYIFKNKSRHIYANTTSILSPIDGKVIAIDNSHGKTKLYCKVNLFDDHIVRAPIASDLQVKKFQHGINLDPNSVKSKLLNEQIVLKFDDLKIRFISGLCNIALHKPDETISYQQGDSLFTFIDGIVIITIKHNNNLAINIGDKLLSGQTILFKR